MQLQRLQRRCVGIRVGLGTVQYPDIVRELVKEVGENIRDGPIERLLTFMPSRPLGL